MRGRAMALIAICLAGGASAHDMHQHGHEAKAINQALPATFVASNDRPFAQLMNEAMAIMDRDMQAAPINGRPEHDFVTMMLPHHQGAVDMAKAVLINTNDPELRNLALGIIAEQQNEINVMRGWLARHTDHKEKQ
ncbi:DUF305 domain-containing protein [Massilia dura]|uniref:DUF305 domain-containing protein n=2 Tax=Pseudoduganella dura TaxID=321982 RepID=A0A6I3XHQ1_9BURK|nr:DUF305 domain-containing protein [Pseudoduganella dura]